jgi:MFS family permease
VADSVSEEQRGAAFGLRQSLDTVGAVIGPCLAFILMMSSSNNYRFLFLVALLPAVMAVLALAIGLQEKEKAKNASKGNPLHWDALRSLGKAYWLLFAVALVFNLANSSDAFILLRLKQLGLSSSLVPLALVLMNLTYALSAYPLGVLSDRIGRFALFLAATLIYAIVYAGFAFSGSFVQIFFFLAIYGIQMGAGQGALLAMVADVVPVDRRGTAFGFINLATGITMLPASLIAGYLWEHVSPGAPFIFASGVALIAALLFGLVCKQK